MKLFLLFIYFKTRHLALMVEICLETVRATAVCENTKKKNQSCDGSLLGLLGEILLYHNHE